MIEIIETHHVTGWVVGKIRFPTSSLTLIAKGTYDLRPGVAVPPSGEQLQIEPDLYENPDDIQGAIAYPSDLVHFKPQADVLISAVAYPPRASSVTKLQVAIEVGKLRKRLIVVGDRQASVTALGTTFGSPTPFTAMPLSWRNSYGGLGYVHNPVGKGFILEGDASSYQSLALPNIEFTDRTLSDLTKYDAAGFSPISPMWPARRSKLGTFDEEYLKKQWPWLPADLDWSFFNAAPIDQQMDGYLRGDEQLHFENLHKDHSDLRCALPGIRVRTFYSDVIRAPIGFVEVPMVIDTLWVDLAANKLVLIWRGNVDLRKEDVGENDRVLYVSEPMTEASLPLSHYEELMYERSALMLSGAAALDEGEKLTEPEAEPLPEMSVDEKQEEDRADVAVVTPDASFSAEAERFDDLAESADVEVESVGIASCLARVARGENLEGLDLTDADFSDTLLENVSFRNSVLASALFRRARLKGAVFAGAILADADLTLADLTAASLENADCTGARFVDANLAEANLDGADCSDADFRRALMDKARGHGAVFERARFEKTHAHSVDFQTAVLANAKLSEADFSDANLNEASIEDAQAFPFVAPRALMKELRASGAVLWASNLQDVSAQSSVWDMADLRRADFSGADLTGAQFAKCKMQQVNLSSARLKSARLVESILHGANMEYADLFESSLERADIRKARLAYANLFDVDFTDCLYDEVDMQGASLKRSPTMR